MRDLADSEVDFGATTSTFDADLLQNLVARTASDPEAIAPPPTREQDDFGSLGFIVPSEDVGVCVNTLRVWNSTPRN